MPDTSLFLDVFATGLKEYLNSEHVARYLERKRKSSTFFDGMTFFNPEQLKEIFNHVVHVGKTETGIQQDCKTVALGVSNLICNEEGNGLNQQFKEGLGNENYSQLVAIFGGDEEALINNLLKSSLVLYGQVFTAGAEQLIQANDNQSEQIKSMRDALNPRLNYWGSNMTLERISTNENKTMESIDSLTDTINELEGLIREEAANFQAYQTRLSESDANPQEMNQVQKISTRLAGIISTLESSKMKLEMAQTLESRAVISDELQKIPSRLNEVIQNLNPSNQQNVQANIERLNARIEIMVTGHPIKRELAMPPLPEVPKEEVAEEPPLPPLPRTPTEETRKNRGVLTRQERVKNFSKKSIDELPVVKLDKTFNEIGITLDRKQTSSSDLAQNIERTKVFKKEIHASKSTVVDTREVLNQDSDSTVKPK